MPGKRVAKTSLPNPVVLQRELSHDKIPADSADASQKKALKSGPPSHGLRKKGLEGGSTKEKHGSVQGHRRRCACEGGAVVWFGAWDKRVRREKGKCRKKPAKPQR